MRDIGMIQVIQGNRGMVIIFQASSFLSMPRIGNNLYTQGKRSAYTLFFSDLTSIGRCNEYLTLFASFLSTYFRSFSVTIIIIIKIHIFCPKLFQEFDSTYGPAWHCIVGTSFGSYVTHSIGGFLYFSIDKVYVLLFRTAVEPLNH